MIIEGCYSNKNKIVLILLFFINLFHSNKKMKQISFTNNLLLIYFILLKNEAIQFLIIYFILIKKLSNLVLLTIFINLFHFNNSKNNIILL